MMLVALFMAEAALAITNHEGVYYAPDPRTYFTNFFGVLPHQENLPMVVNIPLPSTYPQDTYGDQVLVYEVSTNSYIASTLNYSLQPEIVPYQILENLSTDGSVGDEYQLLDGNVNTAVDLLVAANSNTASTDFIVTAPTFVTLSDLTITYAPQSPLPTEVALYARDQYGVENLVLRRTGLNTTFLQFPPQTSQIWRLAFTYTEPVRVSELRFGPVTTNTVIDGLLFLAQPNQIYEVYIFKEPGELPYIPFRDSGNLIADGAKVVEVTPLRTNPYWIPKDIDEDGIPDTIDNCPNHVNPDQVSTRGTGYGDVCDDFDFDGIINSIDNCQLIPNPDQRDEDGDGIGDACDAAESRLTEQYPWAPWVGLGIALLVILSLFVVVAKQPVPKPEEGESEGRDE